MEIFLAGLVAGIGVGSIRRGSLRNVAALPVGVSATVTVWLALAIQVAMRWLPTGPTRSFALATSYLLVGLALAYVLMRFRGSTSRLLRAAVALALVGWSLNFLPIAANGAMPVAIPRSATASSEHDLPDGDALIAKHIPASSDARFATLGDTLLIDPPGTVLSVGDIVIALALCAFFAQGMVERPTAMRTVRTP